MWKYFGLFLHLVFFLITCFTDSKWSNIARVLHCHNEKPPLFAVRKEWLNNNVPFGWKSVTIKHICFKHFSAAQLHSGETRRKLKKGEFPFKKKRFRAEIDEIKGTSSFHFEWTYREKKSNDTLKMRQFQSVVVEWQTRCEIFFLAY